MSFEEFLQKRILDPLKMKDTGFTVPKEKADRLPNCYVHDMKSGGLVDNTESVKDLHDPEKHKLRVPSGGYALVSTMDDYFRFAQMLLNRGELDGVRILGSRTVDFMMQNQLPGNQTLDNFALNGKDNVLFQTNYVLPGLGFGFGGSVVENPIATNVLGGKGSFSWSGLAGTYFYVDPKEELICMYMTQAYFSEPIWKSGLYTLVYTSLID